MFLVISVRLCLESFVTAVLQVVPCHLTKSLYTLPPLQTLLRLPPCRYNLRNTVHVYFLFISNSGSPSSLLLYCKKPTLACLETQTLILTQRHFGQFRKPEFYTRTTQNITTHFARLFAEKQFNAVAEKRNNNPKTRTKMSVFPLLQSRMKK